MDGKPLSIESERKDDPSNVRAVTSVQAGGALTEPKFSYFQTGAFEFPSRRQVVAGLNPPLSATVDPAAWIKASPMGKDRCCIIVCVSAYPGFPFWILASSILRSFSLEGKPFLTAGTHRAGPKCLHWTLSFSEGDNSSVGRQFFRHSSELHSAASRFRTRERPFYPLGSGSAQILCSMSPNSLRFRCPSANNNQ